MAKKLLGDARLAGLGNCWRTAALLWCVPRWTGEIILLIAAVVWALLLLAYLGKWIWSRSQALSEFRQPIQCCFIGLVPVSTMLIALAAAPYSSDAETRSTGPLTSKQRHPDISTSQDRYEAPHRRGGLQVSQLTFVQFYDQRHIGARVLRQSFYDGSVMHRQRMFILVGLRLYILAL